MMLKHVLLLALASVLGVLFTPIFGTVLHGLTVLHTFAVNHITSVFAADHAGMVIRDSLVLFGLPVCSGIVFAGSMWIAKKPRFDYIPAFVWAIWLTLLTTLAIQHL